KIEEVKSEFSPIQLKVPQVASNTLPGRSPAIDFASNEIDPQMMSMEDFVGQKNLVNKKNNTSAFQGYGIKSEQKKELVSNGLKATEVVTETTSTPENSSVNSQQFILNMMSESSPKTSE